MASYEKHLHTRDDLYREPILYAVRQLEASLSPSCLLDYSREKIGNARQALDRAEARLDALDPDR